MYSFEGVFDWVGIILGGVGWGGYLDHSILVADVFLCKMGFVFCFSPPFFLYDYTQCGGV